MDTHLPLATLCLSLVPFLVFRSWNCGEECSQVRVKQNFLHLAALKSLTTCLSKHTLVPFAAQEISLEYSTFVLWLYGQLSEIRSCL